MVARPSYEDAPSARFRYIVHSTSVESLFPLTLLHGAAGRHEGGAAFARSALSRRALTWVQSHARAAFSGGAGGGGMSP